MVLSNITIPYVAGVNPEFDALFNDVLSGAGDFVASTSPSLRWGECYAIATSLYQTLINIRSYAAQIDPAQADIFLYRWQNIYQNAPNQTIEGLQTFIQALELQVGTPATLQNVQNVLDNILDGYFIGFEWIPLNNATWSTFAPPSTGNQVNSILSNIILHCSVPRVWEDAPTVPLQNVVQALSTWQPYIQNWVPTATNVNAVIPSFSGAQWGGGQANVNDGYCDIIVITPGSTQVRSTLPYGTSYGCSNFGLDFPGVVDNALTSPPNGQLFEYVNLFGEIITNYVVAVNVPLNTLTLARPAPTDVGFYFTTTYRSYGFVAGVTPLGPTSVLGY